MPRTRRILLLLAALFVCACSGSPSSRAVREVGGSPTATAAGGPNDTPSPSVALSATAAAASSPTAGAAPADPQAYLDRALDILQMESIRSSRLDWSTVRQEAHARAQEAQSTAETYPAIRWVIEQLGERHTDFLEPAEAQLRLAGSQRGVGLAVAPADGVVVRVAVDSSAERAGIRFGDRILAINGTPVRPDKSAAAQLRAVPGDSVELTVQRAGQVEPSVVRLEIGQFSATAPPEGRRLAGGIGYIEVPPVVGVSPASAVNAVAAEIQRLIREVDQSPACGWVVDLRRNTGGNMWPMLAGIGPVLGEGEAGAFVDGKSERYVWAYRGGQALLAGRTMAGTTERTYTLLRPEPPVAVLTSGITASSGEAIVVAFRGRPATRSFGEPTTGVPTGNAFRPLPDGAVINVTGVLDADRSGQTYDDRIPPDEVVPIDWTAFATESDPVLRAATAWLLAQPVCHG
ncbi:MAG: S41 family peptidase [Dehalococcoidia bacterium]